MASDIVITPSRGSTSVNAKIDFTGASTASSQIRLEVLPDNSLSFVGTTGSLFSIADSVTGSLMSVNDASGLPILEVFDTDKVVMGQYNQNTLVVNGTQVGIGTGSPTNKLTIAGVNSNGITLTGANGTITSAGATPNLILSAGTNIYLRPSSGYNVVVDSGDGINITSSSIKAPAFYYNSDTSSRWVNGYQLFLRGSQPTIYFRDTDHNSAMIHVNSNIFYILRGANDSESWSQVNSRWPMEIDLTNNNMAIGGNLNVAAGTGTVTAGQFTGSGAGLSTSTVPIASLVAGDYSSKITSGTYSISITDNAATATSADQIDGVAFRNTGGNAGTAADSLNQNGITYVNTNIGLFGQTDGALHSQAYDSSWQHQIYGDYRTGQIALRGKNAGTWQAWRTVVDSSNIGSYAGNGTLTLTTSGNGISGTASFTANQSTPGTFTVTSNAVSTNTASTIVFRDASGNFSAGQVWATSLITGNLGTAIGSAPIVINGTVGDNDSHLIIKKPSQSSLSFLAWDGATYIASNTYYDNSVWIHSAPSGNTNSNLLQFSPGTGVIWHASSNSSASWNVASGLTLWNNSGVWQQPLSNTLTLNTSGSGISGSTSYNNSGAATFTVTSNATSANTASTIVFRDASGNFSAGTITAALSGNASTASTWQTARNLSIGGTSKSVNGSADVTWTTSEIGINNGTLTLNTSGNGISGSTSFTANQSGAGTFTVTSNATSANTASTIVFRDASGNFSAGNVSSTEDYNSGWFRNTGGNQGLYNATYDNHFYSNSTSYWNLANASSTYGALRLMQGYGGAAKGYLWWDSTGFGLLNSGGNWSLRTTTALTEIYQDTYAPNLYANLMYDRNDTGYYTNPASTSNYNRLNIAGYPVRSSATIDMSNTGTYATTNYYPVTIPLVYGMPTRMRIVNALNSNVPSWATHGSGFTCHIEWTSNGSGWGTIAVQRSIHRYTEGYTSSTICGGITQMTNGSVEVIWLRGGGRYFFEADADVTPTAQSTTYTNNSQSVSPTSSAQNDVLSAATDTRPSFQRLNLTQGTGTAPMTVSSTTLVTNLNADLLDGYNSAETGSSIILRTQSNGYLNIDNWIQVGSAGLYSSVNSAHWTPNQTGSYSPWRIINSRGGWGGIYDDYSGVNWMHDSSGNGGLFRPANSRWFIYGHIANNCVGIGGSTTTSGYAMYVNGNSYVSGYERLGGNLYIDYNYGLGVVGLYNAARYQGIFAMGDSYKLPADGTSTGSLYGLAWSHPNAGGVAANLNTHGMLVMENGTFLAAVSGSIRCRDDMRAPRFYDSNDSTYYVDPASTSVLNSISAAGSITGNETYTNNWFRNNNSGGGLYNQVSTQHFSSSTNGYWDMSSTTTVSSIRLYTGGHLTNLRGYVYANNSNDIGFLESGGGWRLRIVGGDYLQADGSSIRGQLFFDSNDTNYWLDPAADTAATGLSGKLKSTLLINGQGSASGYGLALYPSYTNTGGSNTSPTYGMMFASTTTYGTHGAVNAASDWATYFTMNSTAGRGWIFRNVDSGNVASLSNAGRMRISSLGVNTDPSATAGEIRATDNITAYYSDERLKTKLGAIENPIEKVKALSGFYFEANETAVALGYQKKREVGVSAQEVQAILPEIIAPAPIDDKYMTVRYEKLIPLLIEAIKEQQKQIEELKSLLNK